MRSAFAATLAVFVLMAARVGAQEWRHSAVDLPAEAVEGSRLEFRVRFSAPEPVLLHVEVKDEQNVVHVADAKTVSGKGVQAFSVPIPADRFHGNLLVAIWFGENWQTPRAPIIHVGPIPVLSAEEGRRLQGDAASAAALRTRLGLRPGGRAIAVLSGGWGGREAAASRAWASALAGAARRVVVLGPEAVANRGVLSTRYIAMLVVPEARTFPGPAVAAMGAFLRTGGHLITLGAPAFDRLVRKMPDGMSRAGQWLDEWQVSDLLRQTPSTVALLDPDAMAVADWKRSSNNMASPAVHTLEQVAGVGRALHVRIENMSGWDTIKTDLVLHGAAGDNVVTFRARGGLPATNLMSVELVENDLSRWIAVVSLSQTWKRFAVPASSFVLWDPDHRTRRGGAGDRVDLTKLREMAVGLALTHTTVSGGKHEYWFAQPGTGRAAELARFVSPALDTISPAYKLYPVRGAQRIDDSRSRALFDCPAPAMPASVLSTHPRPEGVGYAKARKWRWIPLLQVVGRQGVAGTIATLLCHRGDEFDGGRWASFTAGDAAWYRRPDVQAYVRALAVRMLDADLMHEAGSEFFGLFPDDAPRLGVQMAAPGGRGLAARIVVTPLRGGRPLLDRTLPIDPATGAIAGEMPRLRVAPAAGRCLVTATLLRRGRPIDRLSHEITLRSLAHSRAWITARDGQFQIEGKPWYPHGTNYMPSSGVAIEAPHYFESWLSSESYDPTVIERDMCRMQAMGLNMISAFIYVECKDNRNLVDLLNRCDAHGIRVNLSLRPGTPLDFAWPDIGGIITANRLAADPTVFAYDLAWEPVWGFRDQRVRWDAEWVRWIADRYGSVAAAESEWGVPAPREGGRVVGASDADVVATGPSRMVAAYRRFLDDLLSRKHMEARQKIRTLDERHLLSFRASEAGNPTCGAHLMGYDFTGLARNMDFVSPEGYGRIGDDSQTRPGWFTTAYARLTAPGRPVMWAEFGFTIWNRATDGPAPEGATPDEMLTRRFYSPATIKYTETFYRCFYDMALRSGAAGTVCWWYPGGYRYGENSDYGVIDPDGQWRELTRIVAAAAKQFAARSLPRQPDRFIVVDRDEHADSIFGIYNKVKEEYWKLVAGGHMPGLRDAAGPVDSATAPRIAVGNASLTGANPPKYLNAEFDLLQAEDADGRWVDVPYDGATVRLAPGRPLRLRVAGGNTGRAAWLAGAAPVGGVCVLARAAAGATLRADLPAGVPSLGCSEAVELALAAEAGDLVTVQLEAKGVSRFGEIRRITVAAP